MFSRIRVQPPKSTFEGIESFLWSRDRSAWSTLYIPFSAKRRIISPKPRWSSWTSHWVTHRSSLRLLPEGLEAMLRLVRKLLILRACCPKSRVRASCVDKRRVYKRRLMRKSTLLWVQRLVAMGTVNQALSTTVETVPRNLCSPVRQEHREDPLGQEYLA